LKNIFNKFHDENALCNYDKYFILKNFLFVIWEENMNLKPVSILAFISSLFFANLAVAADSELIVFDWGGYEDPGFFGAYLEKYGD